MAWTITRHSMRTPQIFTRNLLKLRCLFGWASSIFLSLFWSNMAVVIFAYGTIFWWQWTHSNSIIKKITLVKSRIRTRQPMWNRINAPTLCFLILPLAGVVLMLRAINIPWSLRVTSTLIFSTELSSSRSIWLPSTDIKLSTPRLMTIFLYLFAGITLSRSSQVVLTFLGPFTSFQRFLILSVGISFPQRFSLPSIFLHPLRSCKHSSNSLDDINLFVLFR